MSLTPDGEYIITGTFLQTPAWESFKWSSKWGTTNIKLGSGYASLENMIYTYGYSMVPDLFNGDHVIKLVPREMGDNSGECPCVPCSDQCCGTCCVGESKIPHRIAEYLNGDQMKELNSAWKHAENNAIKLMENLQNSETLKDIFRLSADNQYLIGEGHPQLKIKL